MAKNYWVLMHKTASGPKLEGKALNAGDQYAISEATLNQLEFPPIDAKDPRAKELREAQDAKRKEVKAGFRGDALEVLREMSDSDLERHKDAVEEAKKKS